MCARTFAAYVRSRPEYRRTRRVFHRAVIMVLRALYRFSGEVRVYGRQYLEEARARGRVVIATTHANVKRAIPIGIALRDQFFLIITRKMKPTFLKEWYLGPILRLLYAVWIDGNDAPYPRKDIEAMAKVIDANGGSDQRDPKYVLIAISGDYNSDRPEEFIAKRGLAVAHEVRRRWNAEQGIGRLNTVTVPSAEFEFVERDRGWTGLPRVRRAYVVVYGKPIDPNQFIANGRVDCDQLTARIEQDIRAIMAEAAAGSYS